MIITCEKCGVSFKLNEKLLKPQGSKVRCSKCKHIFVAYPPAPEPEPEPEPVVEVEGIDEETDMHEAESDTGLEEEDLSLDQDGEEASEESAGDDFDLDFSLDEDEEPAAAEDEEEEEIEISVDDEDDGTADEEDDFQLSLDEDEEEASPGEADDLELSLDEDEDADSDEEEEFSLDLDEDDLGLDVEEEEPEPSSSSSGDIELSLDEDEEEETEEELDFSEVDNLLEPDSDASIADTVELSAEDLQLDLDDDDIDGAEPVEQQEIDLADLEQTIEMELLEPDDDEDEDEPEDMELELPDIEDEDEDEDLELSEDEDEDFSDIEKMLAGDEDEEEGEEKASDDEGGEAGVEETKAESKKTRKKKEKKAAQGTGAAGRIVKIALWIVFAIVLVAGLAVGAYFLAESMGVSVPSPGKLPFIGSMLGNTAAQDARLGVSIVQSSVLNDFVDNQKSGKLFVITGSVINKANAPRRLVKVKANLYGNGHKLVREEWTYCGNILTPDELTGQSIDYIKHKLTSPTGDKGQQFVVKPGTTAPFMIAVSNPPEDLVEYEVMVVESLTLGHVVRMR